MYFFKPKKTIVTHNGSFHTDDVFACATLQLLLEERGESWKVIRTRDPQLIAGGDYVIDVGGVHDPAKNRFDHHQVGGAGMSGNDIPYASFGLVWKEYGTEITGSADVAALVESELVFPIDAGDNGIEIYKSIHNEVHPYTIGSMTHAFQPSWNEESEEAKYDAFMQAVDFARGVLAREIMYATSRTKGRKIVLDAYKKASDKKIIILSESLSRDYFQPVLREYSEPVYVVYPKSGGHWGAEAIWKKEDVFGSRKSFPASWAGLKDVDLQTVSGVSDAIFCHNGRFLVVAGSKDGALALAKKALNS